jgi:hypothetical protein
MPYIEGTRRLSLFSDTPNSMAFHEPVNPVHAHRFHFQTIHPISYSCLRLYICKGTSSRSSKYNGTSLSISFVSYCIFVIVPKILRRKNKGLRVFVRGNVIADAKIDLFCSSFVEICTRRSEKHILSAALVSSLLMQV